MFKGARGAGAADAGPDGQLAELFARLQTAVDDQAHKKALKISESILEASPGDADATRCKVVALLELARYTDAVACVSAAEPSLRADLAFEHAYALYKSHHLSDALALLEAASGNDDGPSFAATQLKAQLLYRDGRARESAEIYEKLFAVRPPSERPRFAPTDRIDPSTVPPRERPSRSDPIAATPSSASRASAPRRAPVLGDARRPLSRLSLPDFSPRSPLDADASPTPPFAALRQDHPDEVAELPSMPTNLAASYVASGRAAELPATLARFGVSPTASFELIFNVACGLIDLGDVSAAADRLLLAQRVGNETLLDEDLGEDEIADELLPVRVQTARVAALRGDVAAAAEGYRAALATRSADAGAHAVAANNLAALVGPRGEGGADAVRRVERACGSDGSPADALRGAFAAAPATIAAMATNRAIALMHSNHLDRCRDALPAARRLAGDAAAGLVEAALLVRERRPDRAEATLAAMAAAATPGTDEHRDACLARAQIAAGAGNHAAAVAALTAIVDERFAKSPARAATLVALHELAGDVDAADAVLDDIASIANAPVEVAIRAADRALSRGRADVAAEAYLDARRRAEAEGDEESGDVARAGVVAARAAAGDIDAAERDAEDLFASLVAARGGAAPDADALEETLPASVTSRAADLERKLGRRDGRRRGGGDEGEGDGKRRKKTRKRKVIYPKGFDPANPGPAPDPERWLPLRERSSYRSKKKKQVNVRGAQGAANMSAELKTKEFSGGAGAGAGAGGSVKGKAVEAKAPEGMGGVERLMSVAGKKGKKKGKR